MVREQEELQSAGFFDICSELMKIISKWRDIILKITATLILPLSLMFLAHIEISILLFGNFIGNILSSKWTEYWLIKAVYFTFFLAFSLPSTSAVVFTIACVYSEKEITYKKVICVVPKLWKKLMVTFLCSFGILIVYIPFDFLLFSLLLVLFDGSDLGRFFLIMYVCAMLYIIGVVYVILIWQLASVVSVLEESCGFQSMMKSKALIKGKMGLSLAIFLVLILCLIGIQFSFRKFVVVDRSMGVVWKIGFAALSLALLCGLFLFGLAFQTVIYFVCKSYHNEKIVKSILLDHLEVYIGEYLPLNSQGQGYTD